MMLEKIIALSRKSSPWVAHFNSGGCNACDIEVMATLTPRFDVERFGIQLKGSPRHADILICTGPVTGQIRERLLRVYHQMPTPKYIVAVGSCALSGGVFHDCYNVLGGVDRVLPVDVYVPGCPPRPDAIIAGIVKVLQKMEADALGLAGPTQASAAGGGKCHVRPQ